MNWGALYTTLWVLLAWFASMHILLNKRQSRSAMLWLFWVWIVPFLGALTYWYFGFNKLGAFARHAPVRPGYTRGKQDRLRTLSDSIAGTRWRMHNRTRLLVDGDQAYPAMLAAIEAARHSVALQTYIYSGDDVGERFTAALEAAARRGVAVRVLVDGLGAWSIRRSLRRRLAAAGGEARAYLRVDKLFRQPLFNLRNHRKLLLVDGQVAFTGGINISREHTKSALIKLQRLSKRLRQAPIRDVHFELKGPMVADLQASFAADWVKSGGPPLRGSAWHFKPRFAKAGQDQGRMVLSGPDHNLERIYELLLAALSQARQSVDLCTPYFVPDQALLMALRSLGHAGVRVRLLVPRLTDHLFMAWASREYFDDLISAGVQVWEMKGSFIHTKVARIDEDWCFVGSANLDPRSFRLNFELNVELRSAALARDLDRLLESYLRDANRVDIPVLARRPLWVKLRGAAVNLLAPYL
jgi:cardiolipin synthase